MFLYLHSPYNHSFAQTENSNQAHSCLVQPPLQSRVDFSVKSTCSGAHAVRWWTSTRPDIVQPLVPLLPLLLQSCAHSCPVSWQHLLFSSLGELVRELTWQNQALPQSHGTGKKGAECIKCCLINQTLFHLWSLSVWRYSCFLEPNLHPADWSRHELPVLYHYAQALWFCLELLASFFFHFPPLYKSARWKNMLVTREEKASLFTNCSLVITLLLAFLVVFCWVTIFFKVIERQSI